MQEHQLNLDHVDYEDELLSHLRNNVFHLTSEEAYKRIKEDGIVRNNKNGRYPPHTGSEKSCGRNQGWICLFDFRNKDEAALERARGSYDYLGPNWFKTLNEDGYEISLAYLILKREAHMQLIAPKEGLKSAKEYNQYIPHVECWYPADIPLEYVDQVLHVTIRQRVPKDNPILWAHHNISLDVQRRKKKI